MEVKVKRTIDFVPEWESNKKDKSPIVFHLRYLSTGEEDECTELTPLHINAVDHKVSGGEIIQHDNKRFCYAVAGIDNLQINDSTKTIEVKTAKELLAQPGLEMLYYEVLTFIKKILLCIPQLNQLKIYLGKIIVS